MNVKHLMSSACRPTFARKVECSNKTIAQSIQDVFWRAKRRACGYHSPYFPTTPLNLQLRAAAHIAKHMVCHACFHLILIPNTIGGAFSTEPWGAHAKFFILDKRNIQPNGNYLTAYWSRNKKTSMCGIGIRVLSFSTLGKQKILKITPLLHCTHKLLQKLSDVNDKISYTRSNVPDGYVVANTARLDTFLK